MMKKILLTLFVVVLTGQVFAQTSDDDYTRPLVDVLKKIETEFHVQIKYDSKLIAGKQLKYADWRIQPWSVTKSLQAVLAPFDYTYVMDHGMYKIKPFDYTRMSDAEGKEFIDYLETLYNNKSSWEKRKDELKSCMWQVLKLPVLLSHQPKARVILTPKRKYDGYTVENFALETLPGLYVCGSIYMPSKIKGKCPVMLNPNGHFADGRYRTDEQIRCAMEARMGIIAADWDLFAWGESRLQFNSALHRTSVAGSIQILNAISVLNYLLSLKDVDTTRVGITGGSNGGGTSIMISALDNRITLSIPVVMLTSHFAGGCPCESGLPLQLCGNRTNYAEIAAMFAPKPQLVVSDGHDWTSTVPTLEFPFLQRTYGFYNAVNEVKNVHFPNEGHDYGPSKRKAMYEFTAAHWGLDINRMKDKAGNFDENTVTIEKDPQMYAFGPNGENLPANAIKGKAALTAMLTKIGYYK
ncbi:acetylxylan esterase [Microbacter margulisiae]|uniref:Acetyl xylan esterase domain-containing protein n=1 Tax=Microbacter margulisiae TaxID=1350067 RepID=A0A7W5DR40_9PORP|nr:acetylxylan esterase [Microbacter margulisiae]MBB3186999.1 hypothetical protein [Microbacter margulisiae]